MGPQAMTQDRMRRQPVYEEVSSRQADGLIIHPRPVQFGHPPIWRGPRSTVQPDAPNKNATVKIRKLRVGVNLDASQLGTCFVLK